MTYIEGLDADYVQWIISVERYLVHILSSFMGSAKSMILMFNELDESIVANFRLFRLVAQIAICYSFNAGY